MEPQWLIWARQIQATAQSGLTFTKDVYDRERYEGLRHLAAEMMGAMSDTDVAPIEDLFTGQSGYATPKVDVRGAIFQDGKILLVQERIDHDRWTLPGGWADVNQSAAECVVREVREEAGLEVRAIKLAAVYDRGRHPYNPPFPFHIYKMFFICETLSGQPTPGLETSGVGFFGPDDLPELSLSRVLDIHIRRMFDHQADPLLPTDFD